MRKNNKELIENYQVRKSFEEKTKFIEWLQQKTLEEEYYLQIDRYSKKGRNLIVGDVANAEIILTAHYDTQPNFFFPMFMGINWFGFILGQLYMIVTMFIAPVIVYFLLNKIVDDRLAYNIAFWIFIIMTLNMSFGIANKHTVNDNTSGVATLLTIMEDLPKEERSKVCFVFFDQEEVGLVGSSNFKSKYLLMLKNKPLVNFDCVSNGNNLTFVCKKEFNESRYSDILKQSIENNQIEGKMHLLVPAIKYVYPSDQLHFKNSVGVAALKKAPILGYYLSGIHNSRDKVFMEENIDNLKNITIDLIKNI